MSNKPLQDDFKERVNRLYKSIDCKYFVFKIEDLLDAISDDDYMNLINIMDKYYQYREDNEKSENKYFVVNRADTRFDKAKDFFEWLNNKNNQNKSE